MPIERSKEHGIGFVSTIRLALASSNSSFSSSPNSDASTHASATLAEYLPKGEDAIILSDDVEGINNDHTSDVMEAKCCSCALLKTQE